MSRAPGLIAFVTYGGLPDLSADDRLAIEPLRRRGLEVVSARWDDPAIRWRELDGVVLRSCWDYHLHAARFGAWLDELEASGVPVWNPPALVRWNLHKGYLRALEAAGVSVLPTVHLPRGSRCELAPLLAGRGWQAAVVKPAVSAGGFETWLASRANAASDQARLDGLVARLDLMVQPFAESIATEGEHTFVFLAGEYSHAVRKRGAPGEFRVHIEHGGHTMWADPAPEDVAWAAGVVAAAPLRPLYARVDAVRLGGRLALMELELVEPELFLRFSAQAPERFAAALAAALGR